MLKDRLKTALILLPLLLSLLIFGPKMLTACFLGCCAAISSYEVCNLLYRSLILKLLGHQKETRQGAKSWSFLCVAVSFLIFFAFTQDFFTGPHGSDHRSTMAIAMVFLIAAATLTGYGIEVSVVRVISAHVSLCYGCLPWLAVWDLYLLGDHAKYVLLMLTVVFMNDTGAYFCGKRFGKHKLAPMISPNKTIEGAVGGILAGALGAVSFNWLYGYAFGPRWLLITVGVVAGIAGIMGDLAESVFKRFANLKDSGSVFPGHGGFLDRCDSIMFASPIIWAIFYLYQRGA